MFHCLSTAQTDNILESDDLVDVGTHNINLRAAGPHRDPEPGDRYVGVEGAIANCDRRSGSAALGQVTADSVHAVLSHCEPALHSHSYSAITSREFPQPTGLQLLGSIRIRNACLKL